MLCMSAVPTRGRRAVPLLPNSSQNGRWFIAIRVHNLVQEFSGRSPMLATKPFNNLPVQVSFAMASYLVPSTGQLLGVSYRPILPIHDIQYIHKSLLQYIFTTTLSSLLHVQRTHVKNQIR
jgi:hypothetical protein